MICVFPNWRSNDAKGKAAAIGGVVEGRREESASICEESVVRDSDGEEVEAIARRCRAKGHEIEGEIPLG
jgi:hypothetical protein